MLLIGLRLQKYKKAGNEQIKMQEK